MEGQDKVPPRILITGASGLLGRAVLKEAESRQYTVVGTAFTRSDGVQLRKLDLLDDAAVQNFITDWKPNVVVHCAAERRPDVAERDPTSTRELNVSVPARLSKLSKSDTPFRLIYISTDYVFDGKHRPDDGYHPGSTTNPLNSYGLTKLGGEEEVLRHALPGSVIVLRVPVLYGEGEPHESAINVLSESIRDTSKLAKMDSWARRNPTNVGDVSRVLMDLCLHPDPPTILHYSAQETFTKLEMARIFAEILGLQTDHIVPVSDEPKNPGDTPRPKDCRLNIEALRSMGIGTEPSRSFRAWWSDYLSR